MVARRCEEALPKTDDRVVSVSPSQHTHQSINNTHTLKPTFFFFLPFFLPPPQFLGRESAAEEADALLKRGAAPPHLPPGRRRPVRAVSPSLSLCLSRRRVVWFGVVCDPICMNAGGRLVYRCEAKCPPHPHPSHATTNDSGGGGGLTRHPTNNASFAFSPTGGGGGGVFLHHQHTLGGATASMDQTLMLGETTTHVYVRVGGLAD